MPDVLSLKSEAKSLPFSLLFGRIEVTPKDAYTVIPFLRKDREYLCIPGKKLRINHLDGELTRTTDQTELKSRILAHQELLPQIPLLPIDLRHGIPADFKEKYQSADLFIVNSGAIVRCLDCNPQAGITYLESIKYATRKGSLLMIFDNETYEDMKVSEMAEIIGSDPFDDRITECEKQLFEVSGLIQRNTAKGCDSDCPHLGDFITLPEYAHDTNVSFFQKI